MNSVKVTARNKSIYTESPYGVKKVTKNKNISITTKFTKRNGENNAFIYGPCPKICEQEGPVVLIYEISLDI